MENLIIYIAKASGLMAMFALAYYAFLRKETFFNTNRWYLLAGLVTSAVLPLVVYTKVIWIDPAPAQQLQKVSLNHLVMLHQAQQAAQEPGFTVNWFDVIAGMYVVGVLFFLTRFIVDIISVRRLIKGQPIVKEGKYLLVDSPRIKSPFSFFNYIVYNSEVLKPEELENILTHEKVHSSQKHSFDMIIGQLFCVAFWFSPFAWMYKKSISQNLEFIADAEAAKQIEDKKAYQKTLLKITVHPECIAISNHFYQSLIKKRIVMLNRQQSKKRNSWKYVLVLPALVAFMLLFQVQTVAQEKNTPATKIQTKNKTKLVVEVTKDSKDSELEADKKTFKQDFNADVDFQNIKRNQNNEITAIKVTIKAQEQSSVYEVAGNSPIKPFTIEVEKDDTGHSNVMFGTGNNGNMLMARTITIDSDNSDSIYINGRGTVRLGRLDPGTIPAPPMPPAPYGSAKMDIKNDDMLVVIDGVKKGKGEAAMKGLNQNEIASITVLKNKEAKKKYGKDAKKGVIEITTRKPGRAPRIMHLSPGDHFEFNFDMPDMPDMEQFEFRFGDIGDLEDFDGAFINGEFISGDKLTPEERERLRADVQRAREELRKKISEFDSNKLWEGREMSKELRESREQSRKEMEEARKEMEKVRKELEEARKELQKTRASMNKKA
jgi:uncharacterized membrane protein